MAAKCSYKSEPWNTLGIFVAEPIELQRLLPMVSLSSQYTYMARGWGGVKKTQSPIPGVILLGFYFPSLARLVFIYKIWVLILSNPGPLLDYGLESPFSQLPIPKF